LACAGNSAQRDYRVGPIPDESPALESNYETLDGLLNDPEVIKHPASGEYVMFYGAMKGDFSDPRVRIFRTTSRDPAHWRGGPELVLEPGSAGSWDAVKVETPSVVILPDNSFRLYYSGGKEEDSEVLQIGMAHSRDGKHWTKHPEPVLSFGSKGEFDEISVLEPSVILKDGEYWMWYVGISSAMQTTIGLAKSTNGIEWERVGKVLEMDIERRGRRDAGVTESDVVWDGERFHMMYASLQDGGNLLGPLWHAESADGIKWTKSPVPFLERGGRESWTAQGIQSPSIYFENGTYHIWYAGTRTDGKSYLELGIAYRKLSQLPSRSKRSITK
jgi:predicted GH43/DUF377 family glycosyl hydrolase